MAGGAFTADGLRHRNESLNGIISKNFARVKKRL